jgi:hypothetical protein
LWQQRTESQAGGCAGEASKKKKALLLLLLLCGESGQARGLEGARAKRPMCSGGAFFWLKLTAIFTDYLA